MRKIPIHLGRFAKKEPIPQLLFVLKKELPFPPLFPEEGAGGEFCGGGGGKIPGCSQISEASVPPPLTPPYRGEDL